ncbi:MAG: hypothetical protein ACI4TR_06505 [Bacteroidaceae bacterium]
MATRRDELLQQLDVKLAMLIKRHEDLLRYKQMAEALKEENELLKQQYSTLKLAKTLAMGESDVHKAKVQLSRLIRKIDVCISLLLPENK